VDAARQRLAQAGLVAVLLLAGCGSSSPPQHAAALRVALPILPRTLDPAKAGDMPSLNVTHELYSGLTRFSGTGVAPDLARSWDVQQGGLIWVFHLRKNLRWSDDRRLTAQDIRRSWLRALSPATGAPLAGPDLGIVRGARGYHATGRGPVGIDALDDRTLRVRLNHPIPWLDQLVAHPIAAAYRSDAYSGPFRLAGHNVLERNFNYWNSRAVKPSRLVLTTQTKGVDAILPRGLSPPGLPWVQTAKQRPTGRGWRMLPTLAVQMVWLSSKLSPAQRVAIVDALPQGPPGIDELIPQAIPGHGAIARNADITAGGTPRGAFTVAYATDDAFGRVIANEVAGSLEKFGARAKVVSARSASAVQTSGADLTVLGWSPKVFDAYNILDLFPCGSAFNVAHWCDPSYDALMRRAVRTLDDRKRWRIEARILDKLRQAVPAVGLAQPAEYVWLKPGVRGFSWSPIGFYELDGMTRS
jgi:ABC-type oligopeptide transport system substrate-binding subunit